MTALPDPGARAETLRIALEPVRAALLADADVEAARILEAARVSVEHDLADAGHEVEAAVERARRRGERAARARNEQALARSRRAVHERLLAEREATRQRFARETLDAITAVRDDPRYPALLEALERRARDQLGDDAVIVRDPEEPGGVIATAGSLRVDYSLPALARRAAVALEEEVDERCR